MSGERKFIERIKASLLARANVRTPIQFSRKATPAS